MFSRYTNITNIILPDSLKSIGTYCFNGCSNLISVDIPAGVTSIGARAFWDCAGLTSITYRPENVTVVNSGNYYNIFGCQNQSTAADIAVEFTDTVKVIPNHLFNDYNTSVKSIKLGKNVETIYEYSLACPNVSRLELPTGLKILRGVHMPLITELTIPSSVEEVGSLSSCSGLTRLKIEKPAGERTYWSNFLGAFNSARVGSLEGFRIEFGEGTTVIPDNIACGNDQITEVVLPESVEEIGRSAFSGCLGLPGISLPAGLKTIGLYAFNGCSGFTSIDIPAG